MKTLILLRGLPGSGKSTLAELFLSNPADVCSADNFFMKGGKYEFDANLLGKAHEYCQTACRLKMAKGDDVVVVANTSTTERELKPYYDLAKTFNYRVASVIVENRHGGVNIHNVPDEAIQRMKDRFSIKL